MTKVFRGWWVVASLFVMLSVNSGFGFYGLSLYLSRLHDERGFSISSMSGATAVCFLMSGIAGVGVARALRRFDPRPIVVGGAIVAATALALLGQVHSMWQVYAVYGLFGIGFAANSLIIGTTVVARWFVRKRAVALSIASTGLSVGGIAVTPLAKRLIDRYDLGGGTARIAVLYLIGVIVIPVLLLRPDPAPLGLAADGDAVPPVDAPRPAVRGAGFDEAVRSVVFIGITLAFLLALMAQVGGIAQLFRVAKERVDEGTAANVVSTLALCGVLGRLAGGVIMAKVGARRFALGVLAAQSAGLASVSMATTRPALLVSAVIFGLAMGNVLLLHPLLLADAFGVGDYPRIYSRSQLMTNAGVAAGPFLLGVIRDHGGYRTAYVVATALSLGGLAVYAGIGSDAPRRVTPATAIS